MVRSCYTCRFAEIEQVLVDGDLDPTDRIMCPPKDDYWYQDNGKGCRSWKPIKED